MKFKQITVLLFALFIQQGTYSQRDFSDSEVTKLVMLGTGNPNPSPEQSGCALAIVVNDDGWRVNCHEILKEGLFYQDEHIKAEAFRVPHGTWPNAWGFRFTTPDKVIVISGDSAPSEKIIEYASGADILVHEVYSQAGYEKKPESWKSYHAAHHTSTLELAGIARQAEPGLVVLYHILFWGSTEEELLEEISGIYDGKVILGRDLDIY